MTSLADIRVIETGDRRAVQVAGGILAQLGADVVQLEPPEGIGERSQGPFVDTADGRQHSISHAYLSTRKRSAVLEQDDVPGLRRWLHGATVVVDGGDVALWERLGYHPERWQEQWVAEQPGAVYCRISPFGDDGPWSGLAGSDMVSLALGGVLGACGYDDQGTTVPVAPAGGQAGHIAGTAAVSALLAALIHLEETGQGQCVDLAEHDAITVSTEMGLTYWEHQGVNPRRATGRHARPYPSPPWNHRCRDGRYVCALPLYLEDTRFAAMVEWFDSEGMAEDLGDEEYRLWDDRAKRMDHVVAVIGRFCAVHDAEEIFAEAQARRLPWAPLNGPRELLDDHHLAVRGFFEGVADAPGGPLTYPGAPYRMSATPCTPATRPPGLGEHTAEVTAWSPRTNAGSGATADRDRRPLDGVRVLDFSWSVVGPTATRNLAALGAEVLKVEWPRHPDPMRTTMYAAGETSPGLDNGPFFANLNVGKRSLTLDARSSEGMALLLRLIGECDLVVESFSSGVLRSWGLDLARMREINPRIVYVSASGFGHSGPLERYNTWGPTAQAFNGLTTTSGLPGLPPAGWGWSYMDVMAGAMATIGGLAALRHSRRTGEGQHVDVSQVEAGIGFGGPRLLDAQLSPDRTWVGNRASAPDGSVATYRGEQGAPHGVYPTAGEGHYDWCAVTVCDDVQWRALCGVIGADDLSDDPALATAAGRAARHEEIDERLARWTATLDKYEVMTELQAAGVPAGAVQSAEDRMEYDPQLRHRQMFPTLDHPHLGSTRFEALPGRLSHTPARFDARWPDIGRDNHYVLAELLGLDTEEIERLDAGHVTWPEGLERQVSVSRSLW